MWLAGQVHLESVPVQRTWYWLAFFVLFFLTLVCIQYHRVERFIHRFYTRSRRCRYSYSCYRRQICCCDLQTNWFSWIYWVHLRCYFSSIFTSTALLSFLDFHWLKDSDKVLCKIWIPVHSFFGFSSLSIISWWTFTDRLFIFLMLIYWYYCISSILIRRGRRSKKFSTSRLGKQTCNSKSKVIEDAYNFTLASCHVTS